MYYNLSSIYSPILEESQDMENPPAPDIRVARGHQKAVHKIDWDLNNNHKTQQLQSIYTHFERTCQICGCRWLQDSHNVMCQRL